MRITPKYLVTTEAREDNLQTRLIGCLGYKIGVYTVNRWLIHRLHNTIKIFGEVPVIQMNINMACAEVRRQFCRLLAFGKQFIFKASGNGG